MSLQNLTGALNRFRQRVTAIARRVAALGRRASGLTLVEVLVTTTILLILASAALPMAKVTIRREKEIEQHCRCSSRRASRSPTYTTLLVIWASFRPSHTHACYRLCPRIATELVRPRPK